MIQKLCNILVTSGTMKQIQMFFAVVVKVRNQNSEIPGFHKNWDCLSNLENILNSMISDLPGLGEFSRFLQPERYFFTICLQDDDLLHF